MKRFRGVLLMFAVAAVVAGYMLSVAYCEPTELYGSNLIMSRPEPYGMTSVPIVPHWPHNTITVAGVLYNYDEETDSYRASPPSSDKYVFDDDGTFTFFDYPTFPVIGPPTTFGGTYTSQM